MPELLPILELLENRGLIYGDKIDTAKIRKLGAGALSDIGEEAAIVTSADLVEPLPGLFSHAATISLGGGVSSCDSVRCRTRHIDELIQFAAFYSDRVYIENFLSHHDHGEEGNGNVSTGERRERLTDDLKVLLRARPLIEEGLIVPVTVGNDTCHKCIAISAFGIDADKRFQQELRRLQGRFLAEVRVTLQATDEGWLFGFEAPDDLLEHGGMYQFGDELPESLAGSPRILKRAMGPDPVHLSKTAIRDAEAHKYLAWIIFESIVFEMATAQLLKTSFLSDTELPLSVLTAISNDPDLDRRNNIIQQHLTCIVPFLSNVQAADAITLRNREPEAFVAYRKALNTAVDSVRSEGAGLRETDARAIYSDVVAPGLSEIDRAVKSAKRDVLKNLSTTITGWTAAISFGIYSGLVPDQLVAAAQALGMTKVLADLGKTASQIPSAGDSARKEDLYFLWRLRQGAQQRST